MEKLNYNIYENAILLPHRSLQNGKVGGGVVTAEGDFLDNTSLHNTIGSKYKFESIEQCIEEDVIYLGLFSEIWGHCITDNLRRIWFLKSKEYREKYGNYKLAYIPWQGFKAHENFVKLLEILGIKASELIEIKKITSFRRVLIPDESFACTDDGEYVFTEEYRDTIDTICEYIDNHLERDKKFEKIYFKYNARGKVFGEEYLSNFFEKRGFKVVSPEEHSLISQLSMLRQCDCLATLEGSSSHNSVFLKKGAELLLIPRAYYQTGYQQTLNKVNFINVCTIESSLSNRTFRQAPWCGPFCFYISQDLQKHFNVSEEQNKKEFLITYNQYKAKAFVLWGNKTKAPAYYDGIVNDVLKEFRKQEKMVPEKTIFISYVVKYSFERISNYIAKIIKAKKLLKENH